MQVHEKIATYLNSCSDEDDIKKFPQARDTFLYISNALIEFLDARLNSPKKSYCNDPYLMSDFSNLAKEEHFQDDLYGFLQAMGGSNLTYEPQEVGGGRADIGVISDNIQTVIELKKKRRIERPYPVDKKLCAPSLFISSYADKFLFLRSIRFI